MKEIAEFTIDLDNVRFGEALGYELFERFSKQAALFLNCCFFASFASRRLLPT